jgi:hypothetical protein
MRARNGRLVSFVQNRDWAYAFGLSSGYSSFRPAQFPHFGAESTADGANSFGTLLLGGRHCPEEMHRSFVGSRSLRERLRFLRMTVSFNGVLRGSRPQGLKPAQPVSAVQRWGILSAIPISWECFAAALVLRCDAGSFDCVCPAGVSAGRDL